MNRMKFSHKNRSAAGRRFSPSFLVIAMVAATALIATLPRQTTAADLNNFDPGFIIGDDVFYNSSTMSVSDIQNFLNSKVPSCNVNHSNYTGSSGTTYSAPWICLRDFYENPGSAYVVDFSYKATDGSTRSDSRTYYENNFYRYTSLTPIYKDGDYTKGIDYLKPGISNVGGAIPSGSISAAQIIYNTAQQYGINPQVLIVLLQKEQGLITDTWPGPWQYQAATGYGCPDTSPCNSVYSGFSKQVAGAAWQFKAYQSNPSAFSYVANRNNSVLWNPDSSCGSSSIYIQNQATAGLYNYTPFRPNSAALAAGYGEGDRCSSYGNRNFWLYFTDWFGDTGNRYITTEVVGDSFRLWSGANSYSSSYLGTIDRSQITALTCYQEGARYLANGAYGTLWIKISGANSGWIAADDAMYKRVVETPGLYSCPVSSTLTYRAYNPKNEVHLWTTDPAEVDFVKSRLNFTEGSPSFVSVAKDGAYSGMPVWRLYNKSRETHFYTADPSERDFVRDRLGFILEGVAFDASYNGSPDTKPVWRLYNKSRETHFYTADPSERDFVTQRLGFLLEGVAFQIPN